MIAAIAQILTSTLSLLHNALIHDWGWSIIALTFLVRLVIWPLTQQQISGMRKMQALQPKIKALEVEYKDKPDEKAQATFALYKDNGVNPLAGCWPMMIQMPILIGMFVALRDPLYTKQLPGFDHASFFGMRLIVKPLETNPFPEIELLPGMLDLGQIFGMAWFYDKFFYLPALGLFILYGVSSIYYSKQMQAQSPSTDPNQKLMSQMMMPMLVYFGLIFPNGLLLYFVVSNFFQMVQQSLLPKLVHATPEPVAEVVVEAPVVKGGKKQKARGIPEVIDVEPEPSGNGVKAKADKKK